MNPSTILAFAMDEVQRREEERVQMVTGIRRPNETSSITNTTILQTKEVSISHFILPLMLQSEISSLPDSVARRNWRGASAVEKTPPRCVRASALEIFFLFFYVCLVGDWVSPTPIYSGCGRATFSVPPRELQH